MRIEPGHSWVNVAHEFADDTLGYASFGHFSDALMAMIVEARGSEGTLDTSPVRLAVFDFAGVSGLLTLPALGTVNGCPQ